ncbi:MAG: S8 family serine peptidase, partial [Paracoccaceae bacterium]
AVNQFLVVGVESGLTGLAGTSFAAPIISGYAAVLSSKFPLANSTQVASHLLETAHMDYLVDRVGEFGNDLNPFYYGQGEASISRALSPGLIN